MSMEDILKVLVNSRQQGSQSQSADPMADLIGNLLGGGQPQMPQAQSQQQSPGGELPSGRGNSRAADYPSM